MSDSNTRRHKGLRDEPAPGSRISVTVALVLLLCQAQGLTAPAFQQHHTGGRTRQAARPVAHSRVFKNHRRRSQGHVDPSGWVGGAFRRGWNSARCSSKGGSELAMMANPESTQQLRDRDLEFMFYDEAQVGVLLLSGGLPSAAFVCGFGCWCWLLQSWKATCVAVTVLYRRSRLRPDFNLVVGPWAAGAAYETISAVVRRGGGDRSRGLSLV